jgi:aryl-phospho-beta-D-glucosidase BglC (GH1 family)
MPDAAKLTTKPWLLLSLGLLLLSAGGLHAQLIDIDFNQNNGVGWGGGGPNPGPTMTGAAVLGAAGDHWNGINVNTGTGLALFHADGSASPVNLTFTSSGGYDANSFSGSSPFAGTPYDALMEDYLFASGTAQTITLSGLAANSSYKVVLYNAANAGAAGRTTYFTINGNTLASTWDAVSKTLIAGVDYVMFPLALSDASGNIIITYTGNGSGEGDVDGLQIQPAPLTLNASRTGTNVTLSFSAQTGFNYQVQYKTNLANTAWSLLGNPLYGSNVLAAVSDAANAHGSRFYRLLVATNAPAPISLLHASGTNIVNAAGKVVQLKGLNLGGWFIMEKWMCPLDSSNLPDTYSVITNLDSRFGVATEQSLIHLYQTNWITLTDLNNLTNAGFNCVRMPVWWGNFYSITNTTSTGWRADAFSVLDWLVTNCAARGIYVVIDMHGVVGGQGTSDDTGWQNQNHYWTNSVDQSETAFMWTQIAAHYAGNPAVAGYDLINEPDGTTSVNDVWPAYASLYAAIRAVDPGRMIIMEGTFGNWDWSMLPNPATYHWTNLVYSMHAYTWGGTVAQIEAGSDGQVSDFDNHLSWNVPSYVGEWNDMGQGAACYDYSINDYNLSGQSWSMWAYKATDGLVPDGWGWYDPTHWPTTPNIAVDSAATIANDWQQWRTTTCFGVNAAVGL